MKNKGQAYAVLFASPVGKEVLEDLQKLWKSAPNSLDQASLAHLEGQRHVVRYIEDNIRTGEKESKK